MSGPVEDGYARLVCILNDARISTTRVAVELDGDQHGMWDLVLGGHLGSDGVLTFGYGWRVTPDSRVNGTQSRLQWQQSRIDGLMRTETFGCGKTKIAFSWNERGR